MAEAVTPKLDAGSRHWAVMTGAVCLLPLLLQLPPAIAFALATSAIGMIAFAWARPVPSTLRALVAVGLIALVLSLSGFRLGRDTGAALLAAMIAIKPAETFSLRDARSLIGFGLFAPFSAFLLDQGPLTLLLGLVATLAALGTLQRLADMESGETPSLPLWQRSLAIARLIGLGLPLTLAVFWLFPRLGSPIWGVPDRAVARPGLSEEMSPGEWVDLLNDETVTLRVQFFGATPSQSQMYWRGPVLWDFDGITWRTARWLRSLPAPPVTTAPAPVWDYEMEVEPTDRRYLVALELPTTVPVGSHLSIDHTMYVPQPLGALTRWRLQARPPQSVQAKLPRELRAMALTLPAGFNPRTVALGQQWRRDAGEDDAAVVQRALAWIRADFAYSLSPPRTGRNSVDEFLFDHQIGFCEHFASGFAVLMRAAGIPTRIVTGYAGGYRNPIGGYWFVRRSDAHSWTEVWLPQRGWVRVDPTAAVAPENIYDTLADRAPGASGAFGGLGGAASVIHVSDYLRRGWNDFVLGFDAGRQARMLQSLGIDRLTPMTLVLLFALAATLALLWMLWIGNRAPREADPLLREWHRLNARYAAIGLGREPHEPAGHWADRVATARPDVAEALQALTRRFITRRYAPGEPIGGRSRELVRDLRAHRPPKAR